MTTLEHSPQSTDLVAAAFCLLPQRKLVLMGWCYCDANDNIKNLPDELKRISQNCFRECFQNLDSRWQKYIFVKGNYF